MEMLGHDDVAHNLTFVFAADLLEDTKEYITSMLGCEQLLSAIATTGNEMQIAESVVCLSRPGMAVLYSPQGLHAVSNM
jgi:hypothetical protein